jgi:hypothetical protein
VPFSTPFVKAPVVLTTIASFNEPDTHRRPHQGRDNLQLQLLLPRAGEE